MRLPSRLIRPGCGALTKGGGRTLLPHQLHALEMWEEMGRRGILEHATGSGKTFTALSAIRRGFDRNEVALVLFRQPNSCISGIMRSVRRFLTWICRYLSVATNTLAGRDPVFWLHGQDMI